MAADLVADGVADHRAGDAAGRDRDHLHVAEAGEHAAEEQYGLAGQHEAREDRRLRTHDAEDHQVDDPPRGAGEPLLEAAHRLDGTARPAVPEPIRAGVESGTAPLVIG